MKHMLTKEMMLAEMQGGSTAFQQITFAPHMGSFCLDHCFCISKPKDLPCLPKFHTSTPEDTHLGRKALHSAPYCSACPPAQLTAHSFHR